MWESRSYIDDVLMVMMMGRVPELVPEQSVNLSESYFYLLTDCKLSAIEFDC